MKFLYQLVVGLIIDTACDGNFCVNIFLFFFQICEYLNTGLHTSLRWLEFRHGSFREIYSILNLEPPFCLSFPEPNLYMKSL